MPRQLRLPLLAACAILPVLAAAPVGQAQGPPEAAAVIVLDGSGSMWGRLGRETKLYVARDAIRAALPKVPGLKVGLATFGHRRQGDCNDAELVFPPAKDAQSRIGPFLERYNPKGRGPIAATIKLAAQAFEQGKDRPTIVVIADNSDNCRVDTCAEVRQLKATMPQLTIHAIALSVPPEELAQIACLATLTGGRLYQPETLKDMSSALDEAFRLALAAAPRPVAAAPQPQPKPQPPAPTLAPGLRLVALLAPGSEAVPGGIKWRVASADNEQVAVYEGEEPQPVLKVQPGKYVVTARFGPVEVRRTVTVTDKPAPPVEFVLNASAIIVKVPPVRTSATEKLAVTIATTAARPGERPQALATSADASSSFPVAPGVYLVSARLGLARVERTVEVAIGQTAEVDLPLYVGDLHLSAVLAEGEPPAVRPLFIISEDDPEAPNGVREIIRSTAPRPELTLSAGTYNVLARMDQVEVRERVTVRAGARLERAVVLSAGRLTLSLRSGLAREPNIVTYRIERLATTAGQPPDEVARTALPAPTLHLAAGRYRIEARIGHANARTVREIEIKPGGIHSIEFESAAALVRLNLAEVAGGRTIADVFWEIRDEVRKPVWHTGQSNPIVALAAGRYIAVGRHQGREIEHAFEVRAGEERIVEVVAK